MIVWKERSYHFKKALLEKKLPYTIGGGIGQSRICMFYLRRHTLEKYKHLWPKEVIEEAKRKKSSIVIKQDRLR